ncbi:MAG: T9SS type A sorting domain-containing protein [Dysgonamonadaceae bacterium]|jgi:hypothetical protein|nr:T9SS type A sorting domain-containing protein [Dysgonamonadaceae bacterium]
MSSLKILFTFLFISFCTALNAQLHFEDSYLYIGARTNPTTTAPGTPNLYLSTNFGLEYSEKGLNIWRPWPVNNWGNYKMFISEEGKIGIGRKPTTYALEVNGQVWTSSGVLIASDKALKRNIISLSDESGYLERVLKLSGKLYEKQVFSADSNAEEVSKMVVAGKISKEDAISALDIFNKNNPTVYKKEFGFIAQEVEELFPELVEKGNDGLLSVNYTGLIPLLVESFKEQQKTIDAQAEKIAELVRAVESLQGKGAFRSSAANADVIETSADKTTLYQNSPNPFTEKTEIKYFIANSVKNAYIYIFDMQGKMLQKLDAIAGYNSVIINGSTLQAGMYLYSLIADGQEVDTKRMILTK